MSEPRPHDVTRVLAEVTGGDESAAARLVEVVMTSCGPEDDLGVKGPPSVGGP